MAHHDQFSSHSWRKARNTAHVTHSRRWTPVKMCSMGAGCKARMAAANAWQPGWLRWLLRPGNPHPPQPRPNPRPRPTPNPSGGTWQPK